MGFTRWSDDHYRDRARRRAATGRDAFEHDDAIRRGEVAREVHQKMNPFGVAIRESRDSAAHPDSRAVAVLFDVTGSMQAVPRVLDDKPIEWISRGGVRMIEVATPVVYEAGSSDLGFGLGLDEPAATSQASKIGFVQIGYSLEPAYAQSQALAMNSVLILLVIIALVIYIF